MTSDRCPTCHRIYTVTSLVRQVIFTHGPVTTHDIEAITGLPLSRVQGEVYRLRQCGDIAITGHRDYAKGNHKPMALYSQQRQVQSSSGERQAS